VPGHTKSFALVLAGGGARGFAHVGVLRGLEIADLRPGAIVGVSMGAIVAVTYATNPAWYDRLSSLDFEDFLGPGALWTTSPGQGVRRCVDRVRNVRSMWKIFRGWGVGEGAGVQARSALRELTRGRDLEDSRIPVAVCATDLRTGERVVMEGGPAGKAAYASAALAGVLPPLELDGHLLCDGAYADLAPVDVARRLGPRSVVAVDVGQHTTRESIANGFQALTRAVEICHRQHADLRFEEADVVIRPRFRRPIDVLEFGARRECIAAGLRAVRAEGVALANRLGAG